MELPRTIQSECGWLKAGNPSDDLVVSSRIRLARNLEGIPFSQWATSSDLKRIADLTIQAIQKSPTLQDSAVLRMDDLTSLDRHFLAERYIVSREFIKAGIERYAIVNPAQTVSMMINEEDHIRLQMLMAGSTLRKVWETINTIDNELDQSLDFAFSSQFGYLTACPTNVGTGIRCSIMVHLPGMVLSHRIEQVLNAVTQMGLTVRGLAGEGSEIAGNLFQISNQWTLGISENETIEKIEIILHKILEQERKAEQDLLAENRLMIEDKVWRAYALLTNARIMATSEAVEHLSAIRLGHSLGILEKPAIASINEMLIETRPAHLQKRASRNLEPAERDMYRAKYIRDWIGNKISSK